MNSSCQLFAMNHSLRLTVKEKKRERYDRSGKNTEIRENTEGLDFCPGVKLFRPLINIVMYIFD